MLANPEAFIGALHAQGFGFTNPHLALDDLGELLSIPRMRNCLLNGDVVSRFRIYGYFTEGRVRDVKPLGETLYFGSA